MKRTSTIIYLESPNATTPLPWVNNAPDFTGIKEPELSRLQKAWADFVATGEELEIIPDPPPPPPDPDWTAFNIAMLQDSHWQSWALSPDLRTALIMAATTRDIQLFHNTWALAVSSSPPPSDAPAQWQSLADLHHVPLQLV
jgi:hypothetical protein